MYANRKTTSKSLDLSQGKSKLVKQLKEDIGNFCVIRHKEFLDPICGVLEKVSPYNFKLKDSSIMVGYSDLTHISIFEDTYPN